MRSRRRGSVKFPYLLVAMGREVAGCNFTSLCTTFSPYYICSSSLCISPRVNPLAVVLPVQALKAVSGLRRDRLHSLGLDVTQGRGFVSIDMVFDVVVAFTIFFDLQDNAIKGAMIPVGYCVANLTCVVAVQTTSLIAPFT